MAIYVDPLMEHGWKLRGIYTRSCHLFTDTVALEELHTFAASIGMKRSWFQQSGARGVPHYDLTPSRRSQAVRAGAVEVDRRQAVAIWRARRALTANPKPARAVP